MQEHRVVNKKLPLASVSLEKLLTQTHYLTHIIKHAAEEIWSGQHLACLRFWEISYSVLKFAHSKVFLTAFFHAIPKFLVLGSLIFFLDLPPRLYLKGLWFPKIHCLVCSRTPRSNSLWCKTSDNKSQNTTPSERQREGRMRQVIVLHNLAGHLTDYSRWNPTTAYNLSQAFCLKTCVQAGGGGGLLFVTSRQLQSLRNHAGLDSKRESCIKLAWNSARYCNKSPRVSCLRITPFSSPCLLVLNLFPHWIHTCHSSIWGTRRLLIHHPEYKHL